MKVYIFPICNPKIFVKNRALLNLFPYGAKNQKKFLSSLRDVQRRTDRQTNERTNRGDYSGPIWINWGPKQLSDTIFRDF